MFPNPQTVAALSPLTTKGDVWGFDTANNRIPVGANTQILTADSTQALGLKWAAPAAASAMTQISATVLGAAAATIDLQNIPGTYNHLLVEAVLRSATAAEVEFAIIRFNNDSGANYDAQLISANTGAVSAGESLGATAFQTFFAYIAAANATAGTAGAFTIQIPVYAGTTFRKSCWINGGYQDQASGNDRVNQTFGTWRNTAAITRITFTLASGANFVIGSSVYLYGIT